MLPNEDEHAEKARIQKVYEDRERLIPARRYSLDNPGNLSIKHERERHLFSWLERSGYLPLHGKKILDVGCGTGYALQNFLAWGARAENLYGIDIIAGRIEQARRSLPNATLEIGNATRLNYADETFDLVQQFTVFSSILPENIRRQAALEMLRVLKTGGHVIWYDFFVNNPWNQNVHGVKKSEIHELFPRCHYDFERVTVAPPLARVIGKIIPQAYDGLASLRLFSTHYIAFIRKVATAG